MKTLIAITILLTSCTKNYNCVKTETTFGHILTTRNIVKIKFYDSYVDESKYSRDKEQYYFKLTRVECKLK